MRADVPAAVGEVIARCGAPSLIFDGARLAANLEAFAAAARVSQVTVLFAAKSFPHPEVREMAAARFDGFDAASPGELAELPPARIASIVDPSGRAAAHLPAGRFRRVIVGCETVDQVRVAPAGADIAIRLSASLEGRDPAVGAVQDGGGHRRSRFGLDVDPVRRAALVRELAAAAGGRRVGLHVHHGAVAATSGARFVQSARAALTVAAEAGLAPSFLDAGGAWHAVADLPAALAELRAAVPRDVELIVEPGRAIAEGAGFACGRIVTSRELDDRTLCVADLSRICHLRWSTVELVGRAPHPGSGRDVLVAGPTCFEDDVLGGWTVEPGRLAPGDRLVLRGVTGYAVAWNHGFGGIPPADVAIA